MGTAAPHIKGLLRQRYQWACDSLRLFYWKNPLFKRGSSFTMRMAYAEVALCYLFVFPMIAIRLIPIIIVWGKLSLFNSSSGGWTYWIYFLQLFCARMLYDLMEFRLHRVPFRYWFKQMSMHEGMSWLYAGAAIKTLVSGPGKKPRYHVTPKVGETGFFPYAVRFQIGLFALNIASIGYAWHTRESGPWLITLTIWLLYASLLSLSFIGSAAAIASNTAKRYWKRLFEVLFSAGVGILGYDLFTYFFIR